MEEKRSYIVAADDNRLEFSFYAEDGSSIRIVTMPNDVEISALSFSEKNERTLESLSVDGGITLKHMEMMLDRVAKIAGKNDRFLLEILKEIRSRSYGCTVKGGKS